MSKKFIVLASETIIYREEIEAENEVQAKDLFKQFHKAGTVFPNNSEYLLINEHEEFAKFQKGNLVINGKLEYQSNITEQLVYDILNKGESSLQKLNSSLNMHRLIIQTLHNHWNYKVKKNDKIVPIT